MDKDRKGTSQTDGVELAEQTPSPRRVMVKAEENSMVGWNILKPNWKGERSWNSKKTSKTNRSKKVSQPLIASDSPLMAESAERVNKLVAEFGKYSIKMIRR